MNLIDVMTLEPGELVREGEVAMARAGVLIPRDLQVGFRDLILMAIDEAWMPPSDMPLPVSYLSQ